MKGYVQVNQSKNEITGYNPDRMSAQIGPALPNFKGYFVIQFSKPFQSFGTWDGEHGERRDLQNNTEQEWVPILTLPRMRMKKYRCVLRLLLSVLNRHEKTLQWKLKAKLLRNLLQSTRTAWQKNLARIKISGVSADQKSIFYTALFHTMQFPREMSEYGKYYSAFDDKVHNGDSYTDFSLWDTYRALHPLLIFTQPERVNGMINSMLQMYQQGGRLPMWPNPAETNIMIGTHADAVIADAYIKGFRGYDSGLAYKAMLHDAMDPPLNDTGLRYGDRDRWTDYEAQAGLTYFKKIGLCACQIKRQNRSPARLNIL